MEKYTLIKKLGEGGTSGVYLGADRMTGRRAAIKKYSRGGDISCIENERCILESLDHPAIPKVKEVVCQGGYFYLVMEYLPGKTMKDWITSRGRIAEEQVSRWGFELCGVLSCLHGSGNRILFRDLKSGNIMISPTGQIRLVDFGAALRMRVGAYGTPQVTPREPLGTPGYAAPEQFVRQGQLTPAADIYALGAVLYHGLSGYRPDPSSFSKRIPLRKLNRNISRGMEYIVMKCLENELDRRYQTVEQIKRDLEDTACCYKKNKKKLYLLRSELLI